MKTNPKMYAIGAIIACIAFLFPVHGEYTLIIAVLLLLTHELSKLVLGVSKLIDVLSKIIKE